MSAALSSWDVFDPTVVPGAGGADPSDHSPSAPGASLSAQGSGLPFFHPNHELFGFGALLGVTVVAMYYATESRSGAKDSARIDVGPAHAEGDLGLGIGGEK
ncbi:MAG: hypothetical protein ACYDDZ_10940 [Acidimicrobiales bacterium]